MNNTKSVLALILALFTLSATAQPQPRKGSGEILQDLKKLNVLGSVLYIAAHPDDENTRLIAWLANEKKLETAYLSITRGDGGQNLIGPEIREELGIIRTQELLAARRTDGGNQFFTRANDFGYSKTPDETFTIWDRETVLEDMVYVIRTWQPDVIITRFNTTPGTTHGHHTASAILAEEAMIAAADPNRFPRQLGFSITTWEVKRLFWNTSSWFFRNGEFDPKKYVQVEVGAYNQFLGESYSEIASRSRTMHKSQGFGSTGSRGEAQDYLSPIMGEMYDMNMFTGIDQSWNRIEGGKEIGALIKQATENFNPEKPWEIVPTLAEAYNKLKFSGPSFYRSRKLDQLADVIKSCMGLYIDFTASTYRASIGEKLTIKGEFVNRSPINATAKSYVIRGSRLDGQLNIQLPNNEERNLEEEYTVEAKAEISQPYWLRNPGTLGMYSIPGKKYIGKAENDPALLAVLRVEIEGVLVELETPVVYKTNDPVKGEVRRPFVFSPPAFVKLNEDVFLFTSNEPKDIEVQVKSGTDSISGKVKINLPDGWKSSPEFHQVTLKGKDTEKSVKFKVTPTQNGSEGGISAVFENEKGVFNRGLKEIAYDHIPTQTIFPICEAKIARIDLKKKGNLIGYIAGAGDEIPTALATMGYKVETIDMNNVSKEGLKKYDAIVAGIRAYNTNDRLPIVQKELMEYVKNGGTYIIQYNTSHRLLEDDFGPYPIKLSRDRVTVEGAPVKILSPNHPVLNTPNKITSKDFEGWVQERGLYFPNEWDENYTAILEMADPEESDKQGSLLVADYGKGKFVYTGLSFFRELPAGVPGAYRLFANIVSLGKN